SPSPTRRGFKSAGSPAVCRNPRPPMKLALARRRMLLHNYPDPDITEPDLLGSGLLSAWKVLAGAVLFCTAFVVSLRYFAPREPPAPPPPAAATPAYATYERDVAPLLAKYCMRCHASDKKRGGIVLDREKDDAAVKKNRELWERVGDSLREGIMPPEDA